MGLDVVELVMTVEEHYGLTIPDTEAREMRSVGDLHQYIVDHAQPRPDAAEAWIVRDLGIN